MRAFKVFVLGLLYGWLVKLVIDKVYRDNQIGALANENELLREHIRSLERQIKPKSLEAKSVRPPATSPIEQSRPIQTATQKDDLKLLKGVGPTLEKRLNDTGIYTFADIAQLATEELQETLGNSRRVSASDLIAEAKRFAGQK
jgi:predicted flap endonuclease-1-like 5' DNA nuclease